LLAAILTIYASDARDESTMQKTPAERFKVLISILKRQERKCKSNNSVDHNLSNVRYLPSHVEIALKDSRTLEVDGSVIRLAGSEIALETIVQVHWITCRDDTLEKARLKRSEFDCIHIQTPQELLPIEGMGQSAFAIEKFINWVINYG
jgi:hypothetical protein